MNKSDFLKEISSLSREEIQKKLLDTKSIKKKKIQPVIVTPITQTKKNKDK